VSCKLNQDLMDAYLDGEMDLVRSLDIEQHLKECAVCSRAYEERRSLIGAIKTAPLSLTAPANLARDIKSALRVDVKPLAPIFARLAWWPMTAAVLAVSSFLVVRIVGLPIDDRLSQEIVAAHVRSLMANHLTDVQTSNQHVVKPWFNGRLDFSPTVRDFSDRGFPLAGGRLDYVNGRPAAAIVYHRAAHPINLFIWPAATGETRSEKVFTRQGYHLIRWSEGGMTYWAVSDLNEHELKDFVDLINK